MTTLHTLSDIAVGLELPRVCAFPANGATIATQENNPLEGNLLPESKQTTLDNTCLIHAKQPSFNAITYPLHKVDWLIFGTFTFQDTWFIAQSHRAEKARESALYSLLCGVCKRHHLRLRDLAFYAKHEFGASGRSHLNLLIAAKGCKTISAETLADSLQQMWTNGTAKVESFRQDWQFAGTAYQTKYEFSAQGQNLENTEIISPALLRQLKQLCL